MKKILTLLILLCIQKALHAQQPYIYTIKADSVKITNTCDTAELIIENHTQNVPGFLFNKGRGRTEFRRAVLLNDSTLVVGGDSLVIRGYTTANNGLSIDGRDVQLGQSLGAAENAAILKSNREIPMNGFDVSFKNIAKGDAGILKLYADGTKTNASSFIEFLNSGGDTLGRINFTNNNDICIGYKAGAVLNATQGTNTFIGKYAGQVATTAYSNTGIGVAALYRLTTGNSNVSLGGGLNNVTTGNNNIGVGFTSGAAITTGNSNVAIGGGANSTSPLQRLNSGSANVAIGSGSFGESITPTSNFSGNIGIGVGCMMQRTHGSYNVAIGYYCGWSTQIGTNNVVIGDSALSGATVIGDNNMIIGSNISNSTSFGSNNILLGARIAFSGDVSNTTIIGRGIANSRSNLVRLGRADQNIIMGSTADVADNGNRIQVLGTAYISDTLKLPNIIAKADTTAYKPMAIDVNGNIFKFSSWNVSATRKSASVTGSSYTVPSDIDVVFVNYTAGQATITLPTGTIDREITIKNLHTTNTVIISGLDTSESNSVATRGAITVKYTGSAWVGISKY